MIRICRPTAVPNVLVAEGRQLREDHAAQHARGDTLMFDRSVYGHADVKGALRIAQHDKCSFCEAKVSHVAFGDVEHFRPKAALRAKQGTAIRRPGYFWLAYEWTNLLFACEPCNRRHKGSLFPLIDENTRANAPSDDLARETPLFIDPTLEDPSTHIGFREEFPFAIGGSVRGEETLRSLCLDRPDLAERRRERLQKLRLLRKAADQLKRKRNPEAKALALEIEIELASAVGDSAEFAAMARSAGVASAVS